MLISKRFADQQTSVLTENVVFYVWFLVAFVLSAGMPTCNDFRLWKQLDCYWLDRK